VHNPPVKKTCAINCCSFRSCNLLKAILKVFYSIHMPKLNISKTKMQVLHTGTSSCRTKRYHPWFRHLASHGMHDLPPSWHGSSGSSRNSTSWRTVLVAVRRVQLPQHILVACPTNSALRHVQHPPSSPFYTVPSSLRCSGWAGSGFVDPPG
jgi:hypothetical protein